LYATEDIAGHAAAASYEPPRAQIDRKYDMSLTVLEPPQIRINTTEIPYISRVERLPDMKPGEKRPKIVTDHLSPSAIKKYQRCQAAYYFHYAEGLRESSDSSLLRGSAIHEAAFAFSYFKLQAELAGESITYSELLAIAFEYAEQYISRELKEIADAQQPFDWKPPYQNAKSFLTPETLRQNVRDAITLLAETSWIKINPVQLETGYLIYWQDENDPDPAKHTLPVLAYADRIEEHEFFGQMEGVVFDIKTGKRKTKDDIDVDCALTSYCSAHEIYSGIKTRNAQYEMLVCNATLLAERIATKRTVDDFGRLYRLARGLTDARRHGQFLPVDDGQKCGGCDFRDRCKQVFR
jgi:CRISPR/Cas system-associated exonuclease Cas4 (RecB family)